ncbi:protein SYS1 homolog [Hydra vulgaris]|uniref:Protein SYS1 homolog n=1 Tax=Hydra vulgaris TaxID=6087 RepID=T2M950_HYDVU|nr:protein SYS1 homolog [Hydra vulgaris]
MALGQFRSYVWDPILIISQIIAVQSIFYLFLGIWFFCIYNFIGQQVLVQHLFDPTIVSFSTGGRIYLCVFILNSLSNSIALWFIVQRAKQCLDFTCTSHFIHLIICWCVSSFPTAWTWWVMNVACIVLTSLLSEYMCMRYEMKAIPINNNGTP